MANYIKDTTTTSKLANFNILESVYKTVNKQDINVYVAISKNAAPGKHPILVKWHGGAWITGTALYEDWFADWLVSYIHDNNAILIAPNYRMMPESFAAQMYEDVADTWSWIRQSLQPLLTEQKNVDLFGEGIIADLDKVMVVGESAGATLSIMSCMTQPKGFIKSCVATYPGMVDYESEKYHADLGNRNPFGAPVLPASIFHDHVAKMVPGQIVTSAIPPARTDILIVQNQWGLLEPYWGVDTDHFPLKLVEKIEDSNEGKIPYMLLIHGKDDTVCDVELSELFVEKAVKRLGEGRADIVTVPGDHGFDTELPLETYWLKEALKKPTAIWLGDAKI